MSPHPLPFAAENGTSAAPLEELPLRQRPPETAAEVETRARVEVCADLSGRCPGGRGPLRGVRIDPTPIVVGFRVNTWFKLRRAAAEEVCRRRINTRIVDARCGRFNDVSTSSGNCGSIVKMQRAAVGCATTGQSCPSILENFLTESVQGRKPMRQPRFSLFCAPYQELS